MIETIFNLFDTDGEQQLDEEELAAAIFAMGFSQHDHVQVPDQHSNHAVFVNISSPEETKRYMQRRACGSGRGYLARFKS